MFKKESSFLSLNPQDLKAAQGKLKINEVTHKELAAIRSKVLKFKRLERVKYGLAFVLALTLLAPVYTFTITAFENGQFNPYAFDKPTSRSLLVKKRKTYLYYITDGDTYIKAKHWNNAIFQYKAAVHLYPAEYAAKYRLALAYSYSCLNAHSNCEKGSELTNQLLLEYPDNKDLNRLTVLYRRTIDSK